MKVTQNLSFRAYTALVFFVGLLLVEAGLRCWAPQTLGHSRRVKHPDYGETPVPSRQGFIKIPGTFEFTYSNNSIGLRDKRELQDFVRYQHRILAIGDSFTYGIGVNDNETWTYKLERLLSQSNTAVINAGNEGCGTDYAVRFFDLNVQRIRPNQCVLFFHFSDFENNIKSPIYLVQNDGSLSLKKIDVSPWKQSIALNPIYNWLTTHSHLASLVKFACLEWINPPTNQAFGGHAFPDLKSPLPASWTANTKVYLRQLMVLAEKNKVPLKVYYTPAKEDFEACKSGVKTNRQLTFERLADELHLDYALLTTPLACSGYAETDLYLPDGHWTALGHQLAATIVGNSLDFYPLEKVAATW